MNRKFMIGMAVAVLLPLSLFIIAKVLKKDKIALPGYFIADRVDTRTEDGKTVNDTVFHQVKDFQFVNQLGDRISLNNNLRGKIIAVNFIFTDCPDVCPRLTGNMVLLQNAFKKNKLKEVYFDTTVHFVSVSINPLKDSFPVLRAYADRFNVDHDRWWFLTGNPRDIYNFGHTELGLASHGEEGVESLDHSQKIVLIDKDRYIRGYYNGMDTADVKRCADDIILLTIEKKHNK